MTVDILDNLLRLIERGGLVFVAIIILSTFMWLLIAERYLYIFLRHRLKVSEYLVDWQQRKNRSSWYARQIRASIMADCTIALRSNLIPIHTISTILPLLGLLGTVTGMITAFDVMTSFGNSNIRGFAGGISQALLTTTAGLVMSIPGLYLSAHLEQLVKSETEKLSNLLILN